MQCLNLGNTTKKNNDSNILTENHFVREISVEVSLLVESVKCNPGEHFMCFPSFNFRVEFSAKRAAVHFALLPLSARSSAMHIL